MNVLHIIVHTGLSRPQSGVQNRNANLAQQLHNRGHTVTVLEPEPFVDASDRAFATVYSYRDLTLFGRTFSASFRDFVPSYARAISTIIRTSVIDLIQTSHPSGVAVAKAAVRRSGKAIPLIYAPHNVESELIRVTFAGDPRYTRVERSLLPRYYDLLERLACRHLAAGVIAVSERDRATFINRFGLDPTRVYVVPSGCTATPLPSAAERKAARDALGIAPDTVCVLFHGWYTYGPNREAFDIIERKIAPQVAAQYDRVCFLLAGTGAPIFERGNIKSLGFVDNLWNVLTAADVALVPLWNGSGTRLKVFDYMNAALPIVATRKAIEGIDLINREHALITDTAADTFIDTLFSLADDPSERRRIGANARRLLEAQYTWEKIGAQLTDTYERIVSTCHAK